MAKDRDDELNKAPSSGEETFSLEEIMAEFGAGRGKRPVGDDTIPFPTVPSAASLWRNSRLPGDFPRISLARCRRMMVKWSYK